MIKEYEGCINYKRKFEVRNGFGWFKEGDKFYGFHKGCIFVEFTSNCFNLETIDLSELEGEFKILKRIEHSLEFFLKILELVQNKEEEETPCLLNKKNIEELTRNSVSEFLNNYEPELFLQLATGGAVVEMTQKSKKKYFFEPASNLFSTLQSVESKNGAELSLLLHDCVGVNGAEFKELNINVPLEKTGAKTSLKYVPLNDAENDKAWEIVFNCFEEEEVQTELYKLFVTSMSTV